VKEGGVRLYKAIEKNCKKKVQFKN